MPLLDAIKKVIADLKKFWPLTDRQIHYPLLNDPPLRHSSKPHSTYRNDYASYKDLTDMLTRARLEGRIAFEVIHDPLRPVSLHDVDADLSSYYDWQTRVLLNDYRRDLMQSQRDHIEILVEKNALRGVLSPIAVKYRIPIVFARGQNFNDASLRHCAALQGERQR